MHSPQLFGHGPKPCTLNLTTPQTLSLSPQRNQRNSMSGAFQGKRASDSSTSHSFLMQEGSQHLSASTEGAAFPLPNQVGSAPCCSPCV